LRGPEPVVPFVDLGAQHRPLRAELKDAFERLLDSSEFILGSELEAFETEFARTVGSAHAIGVASGTDALHLALRGLGIGPGDEVLVPTWTFVATASAVEMVGAVPVFVDIDPNSFLIDVDRVRASIGPRTRAIIPVHMYGQPVELGPLQALAAEHDLRLVEDACQAHGARLGDRTAGALGDAGTFSFYPSKNLGALGDGGCIVTDDAELTARLRALRHHGQTRKNEHDVVGYTARLDGLQAAMLRIKLRHLERWNERRRTVAARYHEGLNGLPVVLPRPLAGNDHIYHLYVIRTDQRDALRAELQRQGVQTAIHYPAPVHVQPPWARRTADVELPCSLTVAREVLSLPMFPEMSDAQVDRVVTTVRAFFA